MSSRFCSKVQKGKEMKKAILATKVGMTQVFDENGILIPVTVLEAGPCVVTQLKTVDNDGYDAVQVGFGERKERIVTKDKGGSKTVAHRHGANKAEMGHFKKAQLGRHCSEESRCRQCCSCQCCC